MTEQRATGSAAATDWFQEEGVPFPLGATWLPKSRAYNFAIYSKHATHVTLLLFKDGNVQEPSYTYRFDHLKNKSGRIWHCRLPLSKIDGALYYAYQIDGPKQSSGFDIHAFDDEKILVDPYARRLFFPDSFDRDAATEPGSNLGKAPLGVLRNDARPFKWSEDRARWHQHDLVIYEMHVRGFTRHSSSGVEPEHRGTYLGVIEKIPHLLELGVTAVELLPIHQFDPQEKNYWGYMPLNFFSPHAQYASDPRRAPDEFRQMIQAFHQAGIEVLLDVVFNHTAEGNEIGPLYSFKGIDNSTYYMTSKDPDRPYVNFSGTGNTLHCKNRYVSRMILDSMRTWVQEYHVDGFRFDLASVFNRHSDGSVSLDDSRLVSAIRADPVLGRVRLIAEPWDAAGLNQLGRAFPGKRWMQWNGRFRDEMRRFVRGDQGLVGAAMRRLYGSDDLFPDSLMEACHAYQSVNYVNSHDGFTLYDQVAYNERHNRANGEENRDGHKDNNSWNCGWEGDAGASNEVMRLREQQAKNFCCLLMLSNGTPMFCAGDEFLNTQFGNNNPYNQDNEVTWLDWERLDERQDFFRFYKSMIAFRKAHPSISRSRFWRDDILWFGQDEPVDFSPESRHFAYHLDGREKGDADLFVMINAHPHELTFRVQRFEPGQWRRAVDTSQPSPDDISEFGHEPIVEREKYEVQGRSVVVLVKPRSEPADASKAK